ncbi:MAG: hypothetical protein HY202_07140 [Nitrospirae bacterium]|nr:hypothetical protein [Nitrospirota bacterium]
MKNIFATVSLSILLGFSFNGCSGGSSGGSSTVTSTGFSAPSNISAVPTNQTGVASNTVGGISLRSILSGLATDPGTDYTRATTGRYIEEHALSQFDIINTILNALDQTHYASSANIGQGPYKAMIAWQEDGGGGQQGGQSKKLQPWIVDSSIIVENGQNVNQVLAWIQDEQNGTPMVIKAQFKFYASATLKTDGSYQDYGVWTLNVIFNDDPAMYFTASASVGVNGEAIVKFHDATQGGNGGDIKAVLNTNNSTGYGKITFPDYSSCPSWPCNPPATTAKYVYDASVVGVQTTTALNPSASVVYKDRANTTDMTHYYGLYDSVTGADVMKTKSFGFPVKYTISNVDHYAYYGAWQGRHSLWSNSGSVPPNTVVTRMDIGPGQPVQTYTVEPAFSGTLTKRTMVTSSLNNILNVPVNTFVNTNSSMMWNGSIWCTVIPGTGNCGGSPTAYDLTSLVADPNNPNQFISIYGFINMSSVNYVYAPSGSLGPGFYTATQGSNGQYAIQLPPALYSPQPNDQLHIMIGGSIYIEYTDSSTLNPGNAIWVKKKLTAFNQQTWTPTFDNTADSLFTLVQDQQYYLMNNGTNYVVTMTAPGVYSISVELQSVANPVNALTFTGTGTVFTPQWSSTGSSNYSFVTDSTDSNRFLYLVYNTIGTNDANKISAITGLAINAGDIVTESLYGIVANNGTQYNWDYVTANNSWGTLTYLKNSNGYKILDDPISLVAFSLTNATGPTLTVAPSYSGWMNGLPDVYGNLKLNNWNMSADIISKVYNIPDGTQVTDASNTSQHYLVKPLSVSEFLNPISSYSGTLDITQANTVDLNTVPSLVNPNMGAMPSITTVKYSEGKLVQ